MKANRITFDRIRKSPYKSLKKEKRIVFEMS